MTFRVKTMPLADWAALQDKFEKYYIEAFAGDDRMALFLENKKFTPETAVLIPVHNAHLVEALSPGGWSDSNDYQDRVWTLLVGRASAHDDLGVPGPTVP